LPGHIAQLTWYIDACHELWRTLKTLAISDRQREQFAGVLAHAEQVADKYEPTLLV
jgi:hypothetical protein